MQASTPADVRDDAISGNKHDYLNYRGEFFSGTGGLYETEVGTFGMSRGRMITNNQTIATTAFDPDAGESGKDPTTNRSDRGAAV